ncbi:MAG: 50S ribosomal protein L25 [Saprospiraceae bacterium]
MVTVTLNGTPRTEVGKKATKADVKANRIPCVLYGTDGGNVHFTTVFEEVKGLIFTGDFKTVNLVLGDKTYKCIVKDVQFHPVKDTIMHIDFLQLTDGRPVKVELPLRFEGVSPGVVNGGTFYQAMRKVKVKVTPEHLVDEVVADISSLKLGDSLRVKDLIEVAGLEILNPSASPIASVAIPRVLIDADLEEEEEGEEAEGTEEGAEGGTEASAEEKS